MDVIILVAAMAAVGALFGWLADKIFKGERPKGLSGDLLAGMITTIAVGLLDWYVIPAMGFKQSMVILGVILEPAIGAVIVLWLLRRANK
jgi:uncharacterized membrane protein YeaQ/YmgE (transglycosylase-associated protein family)